jgi:hypothetical protein
MKHDRDGFLSDLRARIRQGSLTAMMAARRLGLQREVELELLMVAGSGGEREVATAVAGLGESGSEAALVAVRACVAHGSGRVRANALEALGRGGRAAGAAAAELLEDPHHRARANALMCMVRAGEAGAVGRLGGMLADRRPLHRLAGLWAVERAALSRAWTESADWHECTGRLAELARSEPEPPVRARAIACAAAILARMRSGWEARAVRLASVG